MQGKMLLLLFLVVVRRAAVVAVRMAVVAVALGRDGVVRDRRWWRRVVMVRDASGTEI